MSTLSQHEPHKVLDLFETICSIPHGSGNVTQLADWCVDFAKQHGLRYTRDSADNVVLFKNASSGYENAAPVLLQGHLDMVCAVEQNRAFDFTKDGIVPIVNGDWICANGTTLGGDNGIAVAMFLAILTDDSIPHPPLEIVLTADEEIGLIGAQALDTTPLQSRRMINLDSEEEGVFTVSCAGGVRADCTLPVTRTLTEGVPCRITVSGAAGGHSGVEIHKGRANAHVIMARILYALSRQANIQLTELTGGEVENAIALCSTASFLVDQTALEAVRSAVLQYADTVRDEYAMTDPTLTVAFESGTITTQDALTTDSTNRVIRTLRCAPNGVQAMSVAIPDLVQTSLNLGILKLEDTRFSAIFSLRSSLGSQKEMLKETLAALFENNGGNVSFSGDYPGWAYRTDSPLREIVLQSYRDIFGKEPSVAAIHAGLECGIFADRLPNLDCISFGPDMQDVHTPQERLNIPSCERIYRLLLEILKRCQ